MEPLIHVASSSSCDDPASSSGGALGAAASAAPTPTPSETLWDRIRLGLYVAGGIWSCIGMGIYFVKDWDTLGAAVLIVGTAAFLAADCIELVVFPGHSDPDMSRTLRYHILLSLASNACFVISCVGFIPSIYIRDSNPFIGLGWMATFVGCLFMIVLCVWKLVLYLDDQKKTAATAAAAAADPAPASSTATTDSAAASVAPIAPARSYPAPTPAMNDSVAVSINSPLLSAASRFEPYSNSQHSVTAAPPIVIAA